MFDMTFFLWWNVLSLFILPTCKRLLLMNEVSVHKALIHARVSLHKVSAHKVSLHKVSTV